MNFFEFFMQKLQTLLLQYIEIIGVNYFLLKVYKVNEFLGELETIGYILYEGGGRIIKIFYNLFDNPPCKTKKKLLALSKSGLVLCL